jgi:hypothetical protein
MAELTENAGSKEPLVEISSGKRRVMGILRLPHEPLGMVVFAHGSGSGS